MTHVSEAWEILRNRDNQVRESTRDKYKLEILQTLVDKHYRMTQAAKQFVIPHGILCQQHNTRIDGLFIAIQLLEATENEMKTAFIAARYQPKDKT